MTLSETLKNIKGPDETAEKEARGRWNSLAKPLGSLGALEDAVVKIAGLRGSADVRLLKRTLLVFCADNGVVAQGVSQSGPEVTLAVTEALGRGRSTVNFMAEAAGCRVVPVDVGVLSADAIPGVLDRKVRRGSADMTCGPAMSREECLRAVGTGIELVRERKEAGDDILLLGEMGIGNTTSSCAVLSVLLGMPAKTLAGKGSGLSAEGLERKIQAIGKAIRVNQPNPGDPLDVLAKVGGLDLAALAGAVLGGALFRLPILLDGLITDAAALAAARLCPKAKGVLLAGHLSGEPAARYALRQLGLAPFISCGMRLGEGSGAVAALPLLDQALAVYTSGHTFGQLGIEAYKAIE
ncbi:MAG: nicotinate-nucleotide--dimethylbenzimidazole phosphoribosyltransferase [Lachnospiraceae bacterium]|nr:nicotinate-nucleotide--dimethylbenzimidazole phosphoribosyltransferase [Lachnospiraceae bacterium]